MLSGILDFSLGSVLVCDLLRQQSHMLLRPIAGGGNFLVRDLHVSYMIKITRKTIEGLEKRYLRNTNLSQVRIRIVSTV